MPRGGVRLLNCSEDNITLAAESVRTGGVIAFPTDTVYGLGCDPYNEDAVEKIFAIKGRMEVKPLPLLCSSLAHARRVARLDEKALKLAKLWPGALTLVAELADTKISQKVTAGTGTVGVRIPNHECAIRLIDKCGGVIVGTSANRSGLGAARSAKDVLQMLDGLDLLLDAGRTPLGVESTVVDVSKGIKIVREGFVSRKQIESVLADV